MATRHGVTGNHPIAGEQFEVMGVPIMLHKAPVYDETGQPRLDNDGKRVMRCGLRVGGGIDQDPGLSPQGYPDKGVYITYVEPSGPAHMSGVQTHDKLLQVNGVDFTSLTHQQACKYLRKGEMLQLLVHREPTNQKRAHNSQNYPINYSNTNSVW